jgi:ATP diphosphatase
LLFQVVFHAQMASEAQRFDFDAVVAAICDKLTRRHPHVFGDGGPLSITEQSSVWEDIKAQERGAADVSALHGVPNAMPALLRAYKLSKRAARVGFDFEHAGQCADKVAEELAEVRAASRSSHNASPEIFEEIGDLLFAAANLARKLDIDAEAALRAANAKFERRFRGMESLAAQSGQVFSELDLAAQEGLWQAVKRAWRDARRLVRRRSCSSSTILNCPSPRGAKRSCKRLAVTRCSLSPETRVQVRVRSCRNTASSWDGASRG